MKRQQPSSGNTNQQGMSKSRGMSRSKQQQQESNRQSPEVERDLTTRRPDTDDLREPQGGSDSDER